MECVQRAWFLWGFRVMSVGKGVVAVAFVRPQVWVVRTGAGSLPLLAVMHDSPMAPPRLPRDRRCRPLHYPAVSIVPDHYTHTGPP